MANTNIDIATTIRQMLIDWNAATPAQRQAACEASALAAKKG